EIFNTDQGVQFTSTEWTSTVLAAGVRVSMDGRGRCLDNVFVERLWRTVKYEDIYPNGYASVRELTAGVASDFTDHYQHRLQQALEYRPAGVVYRELRREAARGRRAQN